MIEQEYQNLPKHEALKKTISKLVKSGRYKTGDRLPSQNEMAAEYGVGHNTVREAITSLVHEGLLSRSQGKGTFVSDAAQEPLTFAVVIPHLHMENHPRRVQGYDIAPLLVKYIQQEVKRYGASMLLYIDNDDIEVERENLSLLLKRKLDGVIMLYIGEQQNLDLLHQVQNSGVPLVLLDGAPKGIQVNCVQSDNFQGAYKATRQLIDHNYRRIVYLTSAQDYSAVQDRASGYNAAMAEFGLDVHVVVPRMGESKRIVQMDDPTYHAIQELLPDLKTPFALFASNALGLTGAWKAISEAHVDHADFALACFDEPYFDCPEDVLLIKVIQSLPEISRKSVEIVMNRRGGSTELSYVSIAPEIRMTHVRERAAA